MRFGRLSFYAAVAAVAFPALAAAEGFPPKEPADLAEYRQRHNETGWVYLDTDSGFAFYARNLRREGDVVFYEDTTIPLPVTENESDLPERRKTTGRVNCVTHQQSQDLGGVWESWDGAAEEVTWFCESARREP